jgi:hypothetical protein
MGRTRSSFGILALDLWLIFCFLHEVNAYSRYRDPTKRVTIDLPWCVPSGGDSYEPRGSKKGDTVNFMWGDDGSINHNVYLYPSGSCSNTTGRVLLGESSDTTSYTFAADDVGKNLTFVCGVGSHCSSGQIVTFVNVAPSNVGDIPYKAQTPCGQDAVMSNLSSNLNGEEEAKESSGGLRWAYAPISVPAIAIIKMLVVLL